MAQIIQNHDLIIVILTIIMYFFISFHVDDIYMKVCSSGGYVTAEAKTPEVSILDNSSSRGPELLGRKITTPGMDERTI